MINTLQDAILESMHEDIDINNSVIIPNKYSIKKVRHLPTEIGLKILHSMERAYPDAYTGDLWDYIKDVSPKSLKETHKLDLIFENFREEVINK